MILATLLIFALSVFGILALMLLIFAILGDWWNLRR